MTVQFLVVQSIALQKLFMAFGNVPIAVNRANRLWGRCVAGTAVKNLELLDSNGMEADFAAALKLSLKWQA